jgi:2-polyprenyl-6-methoxyphenol hydroxylase-like FAD-dependent oxidoreductase
VGDAAHATHPAGATGMSLAISGAARLASLLAPTLLADGSDEQIDHALEMYDAERRPAAVAAINSNHAQALRLWQSDLFKDPDAYARAVDPSGGWGVGGAGWGQDPAALSDRMERTA